MGRKIRILVLAANPRDTSRLALDEELRQMLSRIRSAEQGSRFEVYSELALRPQELPAALMRHKPDIVHFSGHGTSDGALCLVNDQTRQTQNISEEQLVEIFTPLARDIQCVVLSACYSAAQARALVTCIPCVVGMSRAVKDEAATAFAAGFYEALAFGESIGTAFQLGRAQMGLLPVNQSSSTPTAEPEQRSLRKAPARDIPVQEKDVPQLIRRAEVDPSKLFLLSLPPRPAMQGDDVGTPTTSNFDKKKWVVPAVGLIVLIAGSAGLWPLFHRNRTLDGGKTSSGIRETKRLKPDAGVQETVRTAGQEVAIPGADLRRGEGSTATLIHVQSFHIDATEITNQEFADWLNKLYLQRTISVATRKDSKQQFVQQNDDMIIDLFQPGAAILFENYQFKVQEGFHSYPVVQVSFLAAQRYCESKGKRLPSDEEWNLAARGPQLLRDFPWGNTPPRCDSTAYGRAVGGQCQNQPSGPQAVGTSPQDVTADGVYDLAGNVAEWVMPNEPHRGKAGVARGGSWARSADECKAATLREIPYDRVKLDVGFRCVRAQASTPGGGR